MAKHSKRNHPKMTTKDKLQGLQLLQDTMRRNPDVNVREAGKIALRKLWEDKS
jgi:hypothetical protein